jgi:3-carboxy-cis,cis-muconate cycloisomerase
MRLVDALFSTEPMTAAFSDAAFVRAMLAFEAALARAQAATGVIPAEAAGQIVAACAGDWIDLDAFARESVPAGTPVIPLVRRLTARVQGDGRRYVHWGATSQDAIDTALMLQMRVGLDLLIEDLLGVAEACATLAERHLGTVMAGRTLMQQALPVTFGLKAARWLALVCRQVEALHGLRTRSLALQFGGAAGTLASLGVDGPRVTERLAAELGLPAPDLPWHTERERVGAIAAASGVLAGSIGKVAADLLLLAQSEVGEVAEAAAPGKGGSSAMPHKRNPVDAIEAAAAARLAVGLAPVVLSAMVQEHERAAGGWQAEWSAVPDLFRTTAGAVDRVRRALAGLTVNPARMQANLDRTGGLIVSESLSMALAAHAGREQAHHLVEAAVRRAVEQGIDLRTAALADPEITSVLSPDAIDAALDPAAYLGSAGLFMDRALATFATVRQEISRDAI